MKTTSAHRVVYVTRDIERALGIVPTAHHRIIANRSPYAEKIAAEHPEFVTLIEPGEAGAPLDTAALLEHPAAIAAIAAAQTDCIIVFKNTPRIEAVAAARGWKLLNPPAALSEKIENKLTQIEWLGPLAEKYLPPHAVHTGSAFEWHGSPLIIQWAHGHTGEGTVLVNSAQELAALAERFPDRPARVSAYIHGPSFTVNAAITAEKTMMGTPNYQITGLAPFTDSPFATVGNDWSLAASLLSDTEHLFIETMIGEIGLKLQDEGWRGLFGVDFMRDDERNRIHLIEINARQPAGAVFESRLQEGNRRNGLPGSTMYEAHLMALLGEPVAEALIPLNDGAQIVQRVTAAYPAVRPAAADALAAAGYAVIPYANAAPNSDLLRIQSLRGIMEGHAKLNARGKEIIDLLISN